MHRQDPDGKITLSKKHNLTSASILADGSGVVKRDEKNRAQTEFEGRRVGYPKRRTFPLEKKAPQGGGISEKKGQRLVISASALPGIIVFRLIFSIQLDDLPDENDNNDGNKRNNEAKNNYRSDKLFSIHIVYDAFRTVDINDNYL